MQSGPHSNCYLFSCVFVRLHKLGLTMSYMFTIRLLEKLGENHDAKVYELKKSLLAHLETTQAHVHIL